MIYGNTDRFNAATMDKLIAMLANPDLNVPFRERSKNALTHLKVLAETMRQLERNTNFLLRQVLNGEKGPKVEKILDPMHEDSEITKAPSGEPFFKSAKANGYSDNGFSTEVRKARQK